MKIRTLAMVGALGLAALALPAAAEAGHRHSRSCEHRNGYYSRYERGYRPYHHGHGHARGYYGYYGGPYRYAYPPAYAPAPVYVPYPRYCAPRHRRGARVDVFLGFGW